MSLVVCQNRREIADANITIEVEPLSCKQPCPFAHGSSSTAKAAHSSRFSVYDLHKRPATPLLDAKRMLDTVSVQLAGIVMIVAAVKGEVDGASEEEVEVDVVAAPAAWQG